MNVVHVALRPTEASIAAGRPSLTPELMAATGARYSRNNEGLASILEKIDPANLDKSVDGIFKMIDYGHQSIADMVPVAMFMDGVSLWLAYHVWSLCPTAGGQESSTRYIEISGGSLLSPDLLGIPESGRAAWGTLMEECFDAYKKCHDAWDDLATANPALMRIPREVLDDSSEKGVRKLARMRRNYAFDRARYYLPLAAKTNVMLSMSARGWVALCQNLLSLPLPEPRRLGKLIREELELCAPRLLRHATEKASLVKGLQESFEKLSTHAKTLPDSCLSGNQGRSYHPSGPYLDILPPPGVQEEELVADMTFHDNRYAWVGTELQRTAVRFGWAAMSIAEIRDLNRHRTGSKYCPLVPRGFYGALDQLPKTAVDGVSPLRDSIETGRKASMRSLEALRKGDPAHMYWAVLGTQYPFEHVTTADKFIYEAELRTGVGAHYKYAEHLSEVLALWYERIPGMRGRILEGSAEPE